MLLENDQAKLRAERMGSAPEGKLLLSMAVPMMLSMLVQALYNVVDSVYVARVSEDCLSALSLAFPAQNIMIGLGTGTGVGVSALVSRALGSKDPKRASRVAGNALFLCLCCWALMALFGIFLSKAFINSQSNVSSIRDYGNSYLKIVTIGSLFVYLEICFERLLQSTGQTKLSMWVQMAGAVTNIILDPFFIFGWCGLPAMGTAGAAIATVIGQGVGALLGFYFHMTRNKEVPVRGEDLIPDKRIIADVYRIAFPSILMMCIGSFTNYSMNRILHSFTPTAVAVYGAYFKLQSFFFMPVFGLNNALVPVVGFNFGAGKRERIMRATRFGVLYAFILTTLGFLVFQIIPHIVLGAFSPSENMLRIGVRALRTISWHFPVAAFCIVAGSVCQAVGKSMFSLFSSLLRQVLALLPSAYLLSLTGNLDLVWLCFPIAEVVSAIASAAFLKKTIRYIDGVLGYEAQA